MDEPALFVSFLLNDPVDNTWPYEVTMRLRRAASDEAHRLGIDLPVFARLIPETDEEQDGDRSHVPRAS
jgi:hypothetical protein